MNRHSAAVPISGTTVTMVPSSSVVGGMLPVSASTVTVNHPDDCKEKAWATLPPAGEPAPAASAREMTTSTMTPDHRRRPIRQDKALDEALDENRVSIISFPSPRCRRAAAPPGCPPGQLPDGSERV